MAALRGIGTCTKLLGEEFHNHSDDAIKVVTQAVNLERSIFEHEKTFMLSREGAIATFGKILFVTWKKLNPERTRIMVAYWLKRLPLQIGKEAPVMHGLLAQALLNDHRRILGEDLTNLRDVIRVFTRVYKKKEMSDVVVDKNICNVIRALMANTAIKGEIERMALSTDEKKMIQVSL